MKLKNISKSKRGGFTLVEITLVISLILGLIAVLVLGAQAYKDGSDRARCIMNISTAQKMVRSYSNLEDKRPGDPISSAPFDPANHSAVYRWASPDGTRHELRYWGSWGVKWRYAFYPAGGGAGGYPVSDSYVANANTTALETVLIGKYLPEKPTCPAEEDYVGWEATSIPAMGSVALRCPKESTDNHRPKDFSGW